MSTTEEEKTNGLKRKEPEEERRETEVEEKKTKQKSWMEEQLSGGKMTEDQVGITQFINNQPSTFTAIIKHRFTDFLVHEIDRNDQVIRLTEIERPKRNEEQKEQPPPPVKVNVNTLEWPAHADEKLIEILGEEKSKQLKTLFNQGPPAAQAKKGKKNDQKTQDPTPTESSEQQLLKDPSPTEPPIKNVITDPIDSKEHRKNVHQLIRELFGGRLISEHHPIENSDDQAILISWAKPGRNYERKPRPIDDKPDYIHFTLQKTNRETQDALAIISRQLKCNVSRDLTICGTKDKRSVSCQRVSFKRGRRTIEDLWAAFNTHPQKKDGLPQHRGLKGIRLGNFSYQDHPLKLGQLNGNRFTIVLRDVKPAEPTILKAAIETLTTHGFLNYFGMQRFGTTSIGTHLIGLSLLRSDWDLAIDLIMRKKIGETQEIELARSVWLDSKDPKAALNLMPNRCVAERSILQFFSKQQGQTDKCGALASIPKNLRMMYIHAYQSYVWNTALSRRIALFGYERPVIGDLVQTAEHPEGAGDEDEGAPDASTAKPSVKVLQTAEECLQYSIHDVVLPLPGFSIIYPSHPVADHYFHILNRDGLDHLKLSRPQAEYSMGGTYRKIVHLPGAVTHAFYEYSDADSALSRADEDELLGLELPSEGVQPWREDGSSAAEHKSLALMLQFSLASSTYATMALREILKSDTSKHAQSALTSELRDRLRAPVATPA